MWPEGRNRNMGPGTRKGWENYQSPPHAGLQERSSPPRRLLEVAYAQQMTDAVERGIEELRGLLGDVDVFAIHASA